MELVYYFIGSLWGASIIFLLFLMYKKISDIRALLLANCKDYENGSDNLSNRVESDE